MSNEHTCEQQYQLNDNFFRAFMSSPAAMAITRLADGKFLNINKMYTRIMGYKPEEILGHAADDLGIYARLHERTLLIRQLREQGFVQNYELLVKNKLGDEKHLLVSMEPTVYDNEDAIISSFIDLTEQKRAEKALRKSEEQFRNIFQHHSAVKLLVDPDTGNIVQANDAAEQFYGWSSAELRKMTIQDINMLSPEQVKSEMNKARLLKRTYFEFAHRLRDGSIRDVEVYSSKVEVNGKELLHSIVHDITERKQAEEQRKKSHDLLSNLARLVPGVIYQYRLYPDGRSAFPYASPGMNDIYEVTPEEVQKDATLVYGRLHPDDYNHVVDAIQESARTLQTFYCEFRVILPLQGLRWRWSQSHPEPMPDGSILWHGIILDITERKQAEAAITHSHDLMRYIIEHNKSAVAVHDRNLNYIYVSQRYLDDYKVREKDIIGKNHYDVFPDLPKKWRDIHQKALSGEISRADRDPYVREGGTVEWTRWECRPWYEADGAIGGIIIYTEVITERVKAEEKLRVAHEKLLTILDSIDAAIYVADRKTHHILFMNKKKIEIFGGDKTGELCFEALRGKKEPCEFCTNDQLLDEHGNPSDTCVWQDQNPITGRIYINHDRSIEWTDGRLVRLQIATDITDFRKMEEQLHQTQKMEAIGVLAGGIAHDFNNILFPIVGHTEMLLEDIPAESPLRDGLDQIHSGALRATALVQQILSFSRQEKNELAMMKMQPIIKEAMKLIRSTIPTTISIDQSLQSSCGPVKADPTQIHQIVMNLSTNAYHAMAENGGKLKISLREIELDNDNLIKPNLAPGLYACLTVADTGTGMTPAIMSKIFDPFFTTKEKGKGTGMGLSVVYGIVTSMNGAIRVNSEPGIGTEFHIYLPVVGNLSEKKRSPIKEPSPGGSERILLVDDEAVIIAMEKQILERLGYNVVSCAGSIEALEVFRSGPDQYDLVITDMSMPIMSGDKLAAELLKIRPDIPIMLCTGFSEKLNEEKAKLLGIKGFLMKPIVIKDLAKKIRELFG